MDNKNDNSKNCKIATKKVKNDIKMTNSAKKVNFSDNLLPAEKQLYLYVRTLLSIKKILPNIINMVDSVIMSRACYQVGDSYIFDDRTSGTYAMAEKIIDLSERKLSLINLQYVLDELVNSISPKYKHFAELKFCKLKKSAYIADDLGIDERSVYRWSNIVMQKLIRYCKLNNYSCYFFENLISGECWIKEHLKKWSKKLGIPYAGC